MSPSTTSFPPSTNLYFTGFKLFIKSRPSGDVEISVFNLSSEVLMVPVLEYIVFQNLFDETPFGTSVG